MVAWPNGVSNFLMLSRSSPSLPRMVAAALPSASSTFSLSGAWACSLTISSPVAVFWAVSVITYCLPRLAIVPVRMAFTPSRTPISRAISGVTMVPSGLPRYLTLCARCCWLTMSMTGDCSRSICNAWLRVVSNTGSPVWFMKSARMIESLVALGAGPAALSPAGGGVAGRYFHQARPPARSASSTTAAMAQDHFRPPALVSVDLPDCGSSPSSASCSFSAVEYLCAGSLASSLATMGSSFLGIAGFTVLTGGGFSRRSAAKTSAVEPPAKGVFPVAIS